VRIGILGGTFNPPHLGHLVCAQEAHLQLGLDRVLLVPAGSPPHKAVEDDPGVQHRLGMSRAAIADDDQRFEVSAAEAERAGPSYTVDTLEQLRSSMPDSELFLIVGGDVAAGFASWREPERVLSLASLAVADRPGTDQTAIERALSGVAGGEHARFFDMPEIGISSTMIRHRVRRGEPTRYLTPERVRAYVDQHGLYRTGSAT
jgi:nicotinate-nucleotide adenylyltransferase